MALFDKADFVGTHVIDTEAKRDFILSYSNNRGHQCFETLAFTGGTIDPPLTLATMLQTYTVDEFIVDAVLVAGAIRGHEFLTALKLASSLGGLDIVQAAGTTADPAQIQLSGWFPTGAIIDIGITLDVDGPGVVTYTVPVGAAAPDVAKNLAAFITEQFNL